MPALPDYKVSPSVQPKPEDYGYDLDKALSSVMGLHAIIPSDAFTAETLGTERAGNGVLIRENGVVLTIGCDKTTPAMLMAAATVNIPAIALSVGPMLNGWHKG